MELLRTFIIVRGVYMLAEINYIDEVYFIISIKFKEIIMADSFCKEIRISIESYDLHRIIRSTFMDLSWNYKHLQDNKYKVSIGMGILTFGENVSITIKNHNCLFIESELKFNQLIDWGKNKDNVLKFEKALQRQIQNNYHKLHDNLKEEKPEAYLDEHIFLSKLSKFYKLFEADMLTEKEFSKKKYDLINALGTSNLLINGDELLISLISYKKDSILSDDEITLIKKIIN